MLCSYESFKLRHTFFVAGLRLEPGNPILNCNLAQAYLNLKEYVEAEKFAKNAIENQENYTKVIKTYQQ